MYFYICSKRHKVLIVIHSRLTWSWVGYFSSCRFTVINRNCVLNVWSIVNGLWLSILSTAVFTNISVILPCLSSLPWIRNNNFQIFAKWFFLAFCSSKWIFSFSFFMAHQAFEHMFKRPIYENMCNRIIFAD